MGGGSPLSGKISKYNGNYRKNENNFPEPENIFFSNNIFLEYKKLIIWNHTPGPTDFERTSEPVKCVLLRTI
jgi:hypothetical protein